MSARDKATMALLMVKLYHPIFMVLAPGEGFEPPRPIRATG